MDAMTVEIAKPPDSRMQFDEMHQDCPVDLASGVQHLVGAKKRKALRVVKHQANPIGLFRDTDTSLDANAISNAVGGNTSSDTGVLSDLSESRPGLGSEMSDNGSESGLDTSGDDESCVRKRKAEEDPTSGAENYIAVKKLFRESGDSYKCPECGDEFSCGSSLSMHLHRAHLSDLSYLGSAMQAAGGNLKLDDPADEFKNEEDDPFSAVLREMKLKGEFPCRLCTAVFPNLRALKGHNRTHLTSSPYRCNMCPVTSSDKGALIRHMRTHNGDRPFECRECQYAFTTKANCERHLRNRHGKTNREELRAAIIYHVNEDSSVTTPKMAEESKASPQLGTVAPFFRSSMVHFTRGVLRDMSSESDAIDFSRSTPSLNNDDHEDEVSIDEHSDEEEQDAPLDLTVDVLDLRKRRESEQSTPHQLNQQKPVLLGAPYFGSTYAGNAISSLPFFYPGLSASSPYSAFLESKLAELGSTSAVDLSALALAAAHHESIRHAQQVKIPEGLLMPAKTLNDDLKLSPPIRTEKKTVPQPTASPPTVKMVLKNGVLVKKQKQRRYRTERPFGCDHCTARFTLRSNMERHIKQQHPDVWLTRPRGHRRSNNSTSSTKSLPTMVDIKSCADSKIAVSEEVRHALAQQLKLKRSAEDSVKSQVVSDEEDGDLVIDESKDATAVVPSEPKPEGDLASVTKLLNNAVAQSFQQFFQQPNMEEPKACSENGTDEADQEEAELTGSDIHSGSDDGSKNDSSVKKKSAYSNAPHRVSCPYCSRKFPWTSSLRRHILTHTGQKPYKCPQCPLWFTTKSNCDRHLLRKHGSNNNDSAAGLRHVTDKPFKCALCPSSAFSSSDNLQKHVDNTHCPGHSGISSGSDHSEDESSKNFDGDAIFKCHLCFLGCNDRHDVLIHLQQAHSAEYDAILRKGPIDEQMKAEVSSDEEAGDIGREKSDAEVCCAFCLKRFYATEDFRRHMRVHKKTSDSFSSRSDEESGSSAPQSPARQHTELRMKALWSGSNVEEKRPVLKMSAPTCSTDLIGNLLGIQDTSLVEQLMSKPADDAARLLGVTGSHV